MESDLKSMNISQIKQEEVEEEEISLDMLLQNNMPLEDYKEALVYFDTENTIITNRNKELVNKLTELEKKYSYLNKKTEHILNFHLLFIWKRIYKFV